MHIEKEEEDEKIGLTVYPDFDDLKIRGNVVDVEERFPFLFDYCDKLDMEIM